MLIVAVPQPLMAQEPLAIVNGKALTAEDLSLALGELAQQGGPQVELTERASTVLRELIIERLVEEAYAKGAVTTANGKNTNTKLAIAQADGARRRVLVESYMRAKLVPQPVTQQVIDQFVLDNPDFFTERKTFHYSELYIAPPRDLLKARLKEELRQLKGQVSIGADRVDVLVGWLLANDVRFAHSKQWRGGEQVPRELLNRLKMLDTRGEKVAVQETGGAISVLVLYASYADPVNPAHIRSSIVSQLQAQEARDKQVKDIGDRLISTANVQIFDKSVEAALKPPAAVLAAAKPQILTPAQKAAWTIQFGVALAGIFVAWAFLRQDAAAARLNVNDTALRRFSYSLAARLLVAGSFAAFLLTSMGYVLFKTNAFAFSTHVVVFGLLGACVSAGLLLCIWKVPPLSQVASRKRWSILATVVFAQLIPLVLSV
jgi:EpsD family peptidyl-prolyl cis-trans isomerase